MATTLVYWGYGGGILTCNVTIAVLTKRIFTMVTIATSTTLRTIAYNCYHYILRPTTETTGFFVQANLHRDHIRRGPYYAKWYATVMSS